MPMRTEYVQPEVAFQVRYQCSEAVIQQHCDAAPDNDRRDFDDKGGLTFEIYHTYKDNNLGSRCTELRRIRWRDMDRTRIVGFCSLRWILVRCISIMDDW
jgi:hypothetical protein